MVSTGVAVVVVVKRGTCGWCSGPSDVVWAEKQDSVCLLAGRACKGG